MTTLADYGQPLGTLPAINAGPSLRPFAPSNSPGKSRKLDSAMMMQQQPLKAAQIKPSSSSPTKKKVAMKKPRLPEVGATIKDLENGVVHVTGRLLGQVSILLVVAFPVPNTDPHSIIKGRLCSSISSAASRWETNGF